QAAEKPDHCVRSVAPSPPWPQLFQQPASPLPSSRFTVPVSRLRPAFASVRGRTGLIPFATAGYPTLEGSHEILLGLADAGVLAIEMGIPFSDPIADGPEIQRASEVALAQGVGVDHVLELV